MIYQYTVTTISCDHCEKAITHAVRRVDAQAIVHIDRSQQRVTVHSQSPEETLKQAIQDEGYTVQPCE